MLQNGDLFLQVRDILLHALASARKELESQMKSSGIHLDDTDGEALLLKRAQFLLYTCRHAKQPTQVCKPSSQWACRLAMYTDTLLE